MLANAAGPVIGLYLLAVALPKESFVGTGAWFFLLINLIKVPFSLQLGLITRTQPGVQCRSTSRHRRRPFRGRWAIARIPPRRVFDNLILAFALVASARLLLG